MPEPDHVSYDLVEQPWVLARTVDGDTVELSLLEVFRQAPQLVGLAGELPTQVFAMTRILLAVLHGALQGPRGIDDWEQLWQADELPHRTVEQYLRWHHHRFDLVHPETPFLQVAGLRTGKNEVSNLAKIVADVPNGDLFFTTRMDPDMTLSFAEAARWVVHCHAFDPSGIKSGAVGDPRVKGGRGFPIGPGWSGVLGGVLAEGATLRETLLLNLIPCESAALGRDPHTDLPAWEREPVGPGEEESGGRLPTGPVDLYTWQSRRIRLATDGEQIVGVLVCNGERTSPHNKFTVEPHTAWRRSPNQEKKHKLPTVYMPLEHDPSRAVWRGLQSLLPSSASPAGGKPADRMSPAVLEWISTVTEEELVAERSIRLRTIGMNYGSQSATTTEIVDDALSIRPVLLRRDAEQLTGAVITCVHAAEGAARALGHLADNLARASGGEGGGKVSEVTERAFAELDLLFREWVAGLGPDTDPTQAQQEWHRTVNRVIRRLARDLLEQAPLSTFAGHRTGGTVITAAHADVWFRRELAGQLRLAYTDEDEHASA